MKSKSYLCKGLKFQIVTFSHIVIDIFVIDYPIYMILLYVGFWVQGIQFMYLPWNILLTHLKYIVHWQPIILHVLYHKLPTFILTFPKSHMDYIMAH